MPGPGARLALLCATLLATEPAVADIAAGVAAYNDQDYAEAIRQFSDPALAFNSEALGDLSWLAYKGLGQPRNLIAAYAYLILAAMYDPLGPESEAMNARNIVANGMTREEFAAAEAMVIDYLRASLGNEGLTLKITGSVRDLHACTIETCVPAAKGIVSLGPAAPQAIPRLEQLFSIDPRFEPRETYVYALYAIGTKAVPALCRIAEDSSAWPREGTFNTLLAASALGALGRAAPQGRPCLLRALRDIDDRQPSRQERLGMRLTVDLNALMFDTERVILNALLLIGDPYWASQATARELYSTQPPGLKARVLAYYLAAVYGIYGPIQEQASVALQDKNAETRAEILAMLLDMCTLPGFRPAESLLPSIRALTNDTDPAVAEKAQNLLLLVEP